MRPERIEELLKAKPPDEGVYRGELVLDTPTARATTAVTRARPSLASAAAAVGTVALVSLVLVALVLGPLAGPSPSPSPAPPSASPSPQPSPERSPQATPNLGVIPWIDATPVASPTPAPTVDPRSMPPCTAHDLVLVAGGWSGATGSEAGGATVINLSGTPCTVSGRPGVDLLDARGRVIAPGVDKPATGSDLVVLQPGGVAGVITVWQNWCGDPPRRGRSRSHGPWLAGREARQPPALRRTRCRLQLRRSARLLGTVPLGRRLSAGDLHAGRAAGLPGRLGRRGRNVIREVGRTQHRW